MDQEVLLDYLIERFKEESAEQQDLEVPADLAGKRRVLRSLMNIRMPGELAPEVLAVQDEYLQERAREKGIVTLREIPTAAEQGSRLPFADRLSIWQGDITRLAVDAIVNAANAQMLGCFVPMHGCIDNCIHSYAGVQLRLDCDRQMKLLRKAHGSAYEQPTGVPMLTPGYNLPAKYVVHVVGPIVEFFLSEALEEDLAACYRNTLDLCAENGIRSVAFCCISTGVFMFPNKRASEIAVKTVTDWLSAHPDGMDRVIFSVFKDEDKAHYEERFF